MDVFKIFSPQELQTLIEDAHLLPSFNASDFEEMDEIHRHRTMAEIATGLTTLSTKWVNRLKKLNSPSKTKQIRF